MTTIYDELKRAYGNHFEDWFSKLMKQKYGLRYQAISTSGRTGDMSVDGVLDYSVAFIITFDKKDCFHLMGLQYLTDKPELRHDRGKINVRKIYINKHMKNGGESYVRYHSSYCNHWKRL